MIYSGDAITQPTGYAPAFNEILHNGIQQAQKQFNLNLFQFTYLLLSKPDKLCRFFYKKQNSLTTSGL
jgi:hypothetical protein